MPQSSQNTIIAKQRQAPRDVVLASWPLIDGGWQPRGLLLGGVLFVGGLGLLAQTPAMAALFVACWLVATWSIWLPMKYEIGPQGVTQHLLGKARRVPWSAIGRIERRPGGVILLRDYQPQPLDSLRGLYLPFGKQKPDILSICEFYLAGRAN